MSGISVKIDGKEALATSEVAWALTQGVLPHIGRFEMPEFVVRDLRRRAAPVELEISDGNATIKIERLYIIGDAPGPNPEIETIILADRRYWWGYGHVLRRYNKRRHIGHKRIKADDDHVLEHASVEPNVWYAPYSLPGGDPGAEPWKAKVALTDVLREVIKSEPGEGAGDSGFDIKSLPGIDDLPFENVEIDDNGADAIRRMLDYLPGVGLTVKANGAVVIYSRVDGAEKRPVDEKWREYKNFGHLKEVSKALVRPEEIHVLFSREFEVKAEFEDLGVGGTTDRGVDDIWADNVMPLPDYQATIRSAIVPRGTWVSFQDALGAWNDAGGMPGGIKITTDMIRQSMVPYNGLWAHYGDPGKADPDNDWGSRISAIQAHWRTTFRLNRRFIDRTYGIYAYRLATINPETGTRAPAICYSDYCVIPGPRMNMQVEGTETHYAMNFRGYPTGGLLDSTAKPAPAIVKVIDKDQGIVHVDWKIDPLRTFEQIMPGFIENPDGPGSPGVKPKNPGPVADLSDRTSSITFNSLVKDGLSTITQMSTSYKCVMLLTAVPASPNNDAQLQRVVIKPDNVRDLLPDAMEEGLNQAHGPIMEIRIGPGIETARVRWDDDRQKDIYRALGIDNDLEGGEEEVNIDDLIINLEVGGESSGNAASLTAIARAAAAQMYATFADRTEGSAGYAIRPEYYPEGRIDSVSFGVTSQGIPHILVTIPEDFPVIDFRSLLPASDRNLIAKIAQPGKEN